MTMNELTNRLHWNRLNSIACRLIKRLCTMCTNLHKQTELLWTTTLCCLSVFKDGQATYSLVLYSLYSPIISQRCALNAALWNSFLVEGRCLPLRNESTHDDTTATGSRTGWVAAAAARARLIVYKEAEVTGNRSFQKHTRRMRVHRIHVRYLRVIAVIAKIIPAVSYQPRAKLKYHIKAAWQLYILPLSKVLFYTLSTS